MPCVPQACWSPSGTHLYVARRSPSIQVYDLRHSAPLSTLALPPSTGPVSAVAALPNGQHLLSASWDCVRVWDVEKAMRAAARLEGAAHGGKMPVGATVVPGHYGGTVSAMRTSLSPPDTPRALASRYSLCSTATATADIDPACRWMFTTSGNRGWDGTSTENLVISELRTIST